MACSTGASPTTKLTPSHPICGHAPPPPSDTLTDWLRVRHGRKGQKGAYKLVNGLHGWVGLGPHRVEDGATAFLSVTVSTQNSQHRTLESTLNTPPAGWGLLFRVVHTCLLLRRYLHTHRAMGGAALGTVTDLHGDQPLVVGLVAACGGWKSDG